MYNLPEILKHSAKCVAIVTEIVSAPNIYVRINEAIRIMRKI